MKYFNFVMRVLITQPLLALSSIVVGIACILWCLLEYKHDNWLSIPIVHKEAWKWAKDALK